MGPQSIWPSGGISGQLDAYQDLSLNRILDGDFYKFRVGLI